MEKACTELKAVGRGASRRHAAIGATRVTGGAGGDSTPSGSDLADGLNSLRHRAVLVDGVTPLTLPQRLEAKLHPRKVFEQSAIVLARIARAESTE